MYSPKRNAQVELWANEQDLDVICPGETWLDNSFRAAPEIIGYVLVSRRDRKGPQSSQAGRGGLLVYKKIGFAPIVEVEQRKVTEIIWLNLLTPKGAILFGVWYRPPKEHMPGIEQLQKEMEEHRQGSPHVCIVGDANTSMHKIGGVQERFLHALQLNDKDAFMKHNVAPLGVRRDIAMLGLLYRIATNKAPPPLQDMFHIRALTQDEIRNVLWDILQE